MVVTGTHIEATRTAIGLCRQYPEHLSATCGVHPHHAAELDDAAFEALLVLAADPSVVAIGECGLDYYRNYAPRDAQLRAFRRQLELAVRVGKPVFLHQRDAHEDFVAVLREYRASLTGGVAHCFTGHARELADCLALELAIGITGWICDERRGRHLIGLVADIPRGRLMIETDAPYLLPRTLEPRPRSRRNEPAYLAEVARVVAEARGETVAALAAHTTQAACTLFGLAPLSGGTPR